MAEDTEPHAQPAPEGATADEVLARAEADDAPFARSEELRAWVAQNLDALS